MSILCCLLGYIFGSIPWGLVIGKVFYNTDIREHGSGNLGGTNAGRVLGKKAGITVIVLDALKALIVIAIVMVIYPSAAVLSGCACAVGHCFPLFAKFKGGKAVATVYGYILALSIFIVHSMSLFIIPVVSFFIILYITKWVSFSSMVSLVIASVVAIILKAPLEVTLSISILALFVIYRHKANIKRIIKGEESKITWM